MADHIIPSSFRCDCGHVSHFSEGVAWDMQERARKRRSVEVVHDSDANSHGVEFSADGPVAVICPTRGRCTIVATKFDEGEAPAPIPAEVPEKLHARFAEVADLVDAFCTGHALVEGHDLVDFANGARKLLGRYCRSGNAVGRGKPASWAAGIVHALKWINVFEGSPFTPETIKGAFGVSEPTMYAKSKAIRQTLGLGQLDPEFLVEGGQRAMMADLRVRFAGLLGNDDERTVSRSSVPPEVPAAEREAFDAVATLVEQCCDKRLSVEFSDLCVEMLEELCVAGISLKESEPASWAAGAVLTLVRLNLIDVETEVVAEDFGVSTESVHAKSRTICEVLDIALPLAGWTSPTGDIMRVFSKTLSADDNVRRALGNLLQSAGDSDDEASDDVPPPAEHGYELKVTLVDTEPPVTRTLRVPDLTFADLHYVLQGAFDWDEDHMHEFVCDEFHVHHVMMFDRGDVEPGDRAEWATRLSQVLPSGGRRKPSFTYVYDFGDDWKHRVKLVRLLRGADVPEFPVCIAGENAAPPEDCGGPWGYRNLCDARADPQHADHEWATTWCTKDPTAFDLDETNDAIRNWFEEVVVQ